MPGSSDILKASELRGFRVDDGFEHFPNSAFRASPGEFRPGCVYCFLRGVIPDCWADNPIDKVKWAAKDVHDNDIREQARNFGGIDITPTGHRALLFFPQPVRVARVDDPFQ